MSPDVLNFLAVMLSQQSIPATDPNIEDTAALVGKARRELLEALAEAAAVSEGAG